MGLIEEYLKRGKRIDDKFLTEIFNWIIEKDLNTADVLRVRHPDYIVDLLESFYPKSNIELRLKLLSNLEILILHSKPYNGKILGTEALNLLPKLLAILVTEKQQLYEKVLQVIYTLLSHSMTIDNVHQYFATLYHIGSFESDFLAPTSKFISLFSNFHRILRDEVQPHKMFDHDGINLHAGFQLPTINHFPKAYTISLWFKVESFYHPNQRSFCPRLYTFFTANGSGIDAFFETSSNKTTNLVLRSFKEKSKPEAVIINFKFMPKKWYNLTISHSYSLLKRSEVVFYIDGTEMWKGGLRYPNVSDPYTSNYLFGNQMAQSSFFGQSASFYYFKEAIPAKEVTKIFKLGINYVLTQYTKKEFPLKDLLICYTPYSVDKTQLFDITVELSEKVQKNKQLYNANILPGTQIIGSHSVQDSVYLAGGLDLILPLFIFPFIRDNAKVLNQEHKRYIGHYHTLLLDFLVDFIHSNDLFKFEAIKHKGYKLVKYLLQQFSPYNLCLELLGPIKKLEKNLSFTNPKLKKLVFRDFFFQFSLWSMGNYQFQSEYLQFVTKIAINSGSLLKDSIGIQELLDIMQTYYWFSEDPAGVLSNTQTKRLIQFPRYDLVAEHIFELRHYFIAMIKSIITNDGLMKHDFQCFTRFLYTCNDPSQMEDLLALILSILVGNKMETCLIVDECGSILPFFHILYRTHSDYVISLVIRILGIMINTGTKKAKKLLGNSGFSVIASMLQQLDFSYGTYVSLLEVATDRITTDYRNPRSKTIITTSSPIKTPEFLDILFSLLPIRNVELLKTMLEDFSTLLVNNDHTITTFINHPIFIKWMISLFNKYIALDGTADSENVENIYDALVDLFSVIFHYCLVQKDGWKYLENYYTILMLSVGQNADKSGAQEVFFFRLLEFLSTFLPGQNIPNSHDQSNNSSIAADQNGNNINNVANNPLHQTIIQNLSQIAFIIDEYIFAPPDMDTKSKNDLSTTLKRGKGGKWRDFQLAQDLLALLDIVLYSPYYEWANSDMGHSMKSRSLNTCILRLTLVSISESFLSVDQRSLAHNHHDLLKSIASRLYFLLGKISKTCNEYVAFIFWTLSILLNVCTQHHNNESIFNIIKSIIINYQHGIIHGLKVPSLSNKLLASSTSEAFIQNLSDVRGEFDKAKVEIEKEFNLSLISVQDRRNKKAKEFTQAIIDCTKQTLTTSSVMIVQIEENKKDYVWTELNRRISWLILQDDANFLLEEEWNLSYSQLSRCGLYHWFENFVHNFQYKLDSSEDKVRKRWKMVLNYHSSDYRQYTWSYIRQRDEEMNALKVTATPQLLSSEVFQSIRNIRKNDDDLVDSDDENDDEKNNNNNNSNQSNNNISNAYNSNSNVSVQMKSTITISPLILRNAEEKILQSTESDLIFPLLVIKGKFYLTNKSIYFFPDINQTVSSSLPSFISAIKKDYKWHLTALKGIHRRRYLLRNTALEFFFTDTKNVLIDFPKNVRETIFSSIIATHPPTLTDYTNIKSVMKFMKSSNMTTRWQKREISNFEYLMYLNTIAGRTYNDLSQYPVFPWIISDYESESLDLQNPAIYRDLTKPMGALNPKRLNEYIARYEMHDSDDIPRFFYGSHYSTALVVLYYLIRLEPYTSYYIQLQGRFDHADRIFDSVPIAWNTSFNLTQDVKELIPEFFYCPTFLRNENQFDFGEKQNNEKIGDVKLPRWAKDPEEFVRINAEALESPYVSANLHHWIDLIFGYKQQGKAALEAKNVFYYLTYEGSVNIDKIEDPVLRNSTIEQILSFGQTPSQLFLKSHPPRSVSLAADQPFYGEKEFLHTLSVIDPKMIPYLICSNKNSFFIMNNYAVVVGYKIQTSSSSSSSSLMNDFAITQSGVLQNPTAASCFIIPNVVSRNVSFIADVENKVIISFGHWDGSFRVTSLQSPQSTLQTIHFHRAAIQCAHMNESSSFVAFGAVDGNISVWKTQRLAKNFVIEDNVRHLLRGHSSGVSSVFIDDNLDVIVSGGKDGCIVIHSLFSGTFIRKIPNHFNRFYLNGGVDLLVTTPNANIISYSRTRQYLVLNCINGRFLAVSKFEVEAVNCILLTSNGKYVITGGKFLHIFDAFSLELLFSLDKFPNDEVLWMSFALEEKLIICGLKSLSVHVCMFSQ